MGDFIEESLRGVMRLLWLIRATRDRLIAEHPSSMEVLKPFLRGRDVKRWNVESPDLWLLFVPWHFPLHNDASIQGASKKAEKEFERLLSSHL